jgi:hypothetical protein
MHTDSQTGSTRRELKIIAGVKHFIHREACGQRCRAPLTTSRALAVPAPLAATLNGIAADAAKVFAAHDDVLAAVEGGMVLDADTGRLWPAGKTIPVTEALALYRRVRDLLAQEVALCDRWQKAFPALWAAAAAALTAAEKEEAGRRGALCQALTAANNGEAVHADRVTQVCRLLPRYKKAHEAASGAAARLGQQRQGIEARADWIAKTLAEAEAGTTPWDRE